MTLVPLHVVGGVMGLALGLLVLWWVFRRDPLELGPPIATRVPSRTDDDLLSVVRQGRPAAGMPAFPTVSVRLICPPTAFKRSARRSLVYGRRRRFLSRL